MKSCIFKATLCIFITVAILSRSAAFFCYAESAPSLSAQSAILMDHDSGKVLYGKNERQRMGMASTTKIMTALTVMRLTSPEKTVVVAPEAVGTEGSSVYLCAGERLTVEQLLYALLLASANDAAVALAVFCAGSVESFADHMNAYARELGLVDTHFVNPHGLHHEDHYTTAYDLALISQAALKDDTLRKIFSTYKTLLPFEGEPDKRLVVNHNKLLNSYDGAIGIKTGFTKATGRCLVSAAQRDGMTLICVTLNAPDDWRDHTSLLDYGFETYERRIIADTGEFLYDMPLTGGESDSVRLTNNSPLILTLKKSQPSPDVLVTSSFRFAYAPIPRGSTLALASVTFEGETSESVLIADESVKVKDIKRGFWQRLKDLFNKDHKD